MSPPVPAVSTTSAVTTEPSTIQTTGAPTVTQPTTEASTTTAPSATPTTTPPPKFAVSKFSKFCHLPCVSWSICSFAGDPCPELEDPSVIPKLKLVECQMTRDCHHTYNCCQYGGGRYCVDAYGDRGEPVRYKNYEIWGPSSRAGLLGSEARVERAVSHPRL